jgi:putative ABC transport system permease protein
MIKNYLLIAWRNILRHQLFSFINIFGLALGLCMGMMVLINTIDAFRYDNFHPNSGNVYRIISTVQDQNKNVWHLASTPLPLRDALSENTSIIQSTQLYPALNETVVDEARRLSIRGTYIDQSFFKTFGFTLLLGDITGLQDPYNIILSENTAKRLYGDANPIGKLLDFERSGTFKVIAVMKDPPSRSHLTFDAYASASTVGILEEKNILPRNSQNWDSFEKSYTYVVIEKNKITQTEEALTGISKKLNEGFNDGRIDFEIQSLSSITPATDSLHNDLPTGTTWGKMMAEVGIAFVILLAACFNYTNLSVARALTRSKEVGIRKLSGAFRFQIFGQYIIEAVCISLCAFAIAYVILSFILAFKPFNDGYEMVKAIDMNSLVIVSFLLLAIAAGCIAGALPAWILSSFKPVNVLKRIGSQKLFGRITLRKSLMVFQFTASLITMIFLTAFYRQFSFMASADVGYQRDALITIPVNANSALLQTEIESISGVEQTTRVSQNLGRQPANVLKLTAKPGQMPIDVPCYATDDGFLATMGLTLISGRNFHSASQPGDGIILK